MKKIVYALIGLLLALPILAALAIWLLAPDDDPGPPPVVTAALAPVQRLERGAYLARAGDCMACHTVRGGAPYAGGRAIRTPFGDIVTPNITPDAATGIGDWSADDFWQALHHGKGKQGRLLYPAFPYTNYTRITRDDADAVYAWLRSIPAVAQANLPHQLRFPYNQQWALAAWRLLRERVPAYDEDRWLAPDIASSVTLLKNEESLETVFQRCRDYAAADDNTRRHSSATSAEQA